MLKTLNNDQVNVFVQSNLVSHMSSETKHSLLRIGSRILEVTVISKR